MQVRLQVMSLLHQHMLQAAAAAAAAVMQGCRLAGWAVASPVTQPVAPGKRICSARRHGRQVGVAC